MIIIIIIIIVKKKEKINYIFVTIKMLNDLKESAKIYIYNLLWYRSLGGEGEGM